MGEAGQRTLTELVDQARDAYSHLRLEEALDCYQRAEALRADSYVACLGIARTLIRMRRSEEADAAIARCLSLDPGRFEGQTALGILLFLSDDDDEAISALKRAVEMAPDEAEPRLVLAQAYADTGELETASSELEKARELIAAVEDEGQRQSLLALAWHAEAYQWLSEGENAAAMECAQEVIALEEANPYAACLAYSNLGLLEGRARHYDLAIEYLEHAYQMNPFFYRAGAALGRILIVRGQYDRAARVLGRVLEQNGPAGGGTRYAYATALAKLGRRKEALAQYRRAREEGLSGVEKQLARWQTVWLSNRGRYAIAAIALVALVAWLVLAKPSLQALTLVALVVVILVLQRTLGRRRR